MNAFVLRAVVAGAACLLAGCGSTEGSEQTAPPEPAPAAKQESHRLELESHVDTVATVTGGAKGSGGSGLREPQVRYMVQIGAFRNPRNASNVQAVARRRFQATVINDYNTKTGLYQIRIGSFETREAAAAFRQQIQAQHPESYKDSWIVQLTK
jgi:cell division protein FtsN